MEDSMCSDSSASRNLICSLSYDGSTIDIAINYTLLLLNLFVAASSLLPSTTDILQRRRHAIISFLFAILFQVVLCLEAHCLGISVIWCATMGWIWMDRRRELKRMVEISLTCSFYRASVDIPNALLDHENMVLVLDVLFLCYYAMVSTPTSTVTHILAIAVLGIPSYSMMELFAPDEGPRALRLTGPIKQYSEGLLESNLSFRLSPE